MLIVADENIPCVTTAFGQFGEVRTLHGRLIGSQDIQDADVLLVRSITQVNEQLLGNSRVRFVGSATAGTDHVDIPWLQAHDIAFYHAPGCNAVSAAEYVISALSLLEQVDDYHLAGKTVGIVGCGNVGSRVQTRLEAIGLECMVCDPPRAEKEGQAGFVSMQEIAQADIVTFHVPLINQGHHLTRGLLSAGFLEQLSGKAVLINTSRGLVTDECALREKLGHSPELMVILDVWQDEPLIDVDLARRVRLATPHIAGYSIDGKLKATQMLYDAFCHQYDHRQQWRYIDEVADPAISCLDVGASSDVLRVITRLIPQVYDIQVDHERLRATLNAREHRGEAFDLLRRNYPFRRECSAYTAIPDGLSNEVESVLRVYGFQA